MKKTTRTEEVMLSVTERIAARTLTSGDRLPSIRQLAAKMKVSPSTVVEAYARLAAEGTIRSRPGSGYYVARATAPLVLAEAGPQVEREIDPLWVSRQSLGSETTTLKPGCGWMPADWMPNDIIARSVRSATRQDLAVLADYADASGAADLRQLLSRQFVDEGLQVSADRIMLTVSGTQAIDLVCRFLLQPGDTVIVDDPCYFNFQALLRVHQARVVGVPYTPSGPDVEAFEAVLRDHQPRLYITNSGLHNPTGATLSPQTAHRILSLANTHGLTIIEDEIFAPLEPDPSPRLAALDGLNQVIRIGSFSKIVSASIRCGYIAARSDWIEALVDMQVATNFGGAGTFATSVIKGVLSDSRYQRHRDLLHSKLNHARQKIAGQLSAIGIEPWIMPRGGFYLWCTLPEGLRA